jgi:hypothetical protein
VPQLLLLLLLLGAGLASSAVAPFCCCCCAVSWLRVAHVRRARAGVSSSRNERMQPGSYSCQQKQLSHPDEPQRSVRVVVKHAVVKTSKK